MLAISSSTPRWLEIIIEGYQQDESTKQLLSELAVTGTNDKGFSLVDGITKYKGRIWLGHNTEAHQAILLALHSSGLGGHSGVTATYQKVKALFAWPNLKKVVQDMLLLVRYVLKPSLNIVGCLAYFSPCLFHLLLGTPLAWILSKAYPNAKPLTSS